MQAASHPLRAYRNQHKPRISLDSLAKSIGRSKATLSRIETGKQDLTVDIARKIAAATGIPLRELRPDLAKEFETPEAIG